MNLDLKIMTALRDEEDKGEKKLRITRGAFAKDNMYAKLASRIAGGGMECYSYMLKRASGFDDLVRDVYFADDQDAISSHVWVTAEGVKRAGEMAYERGMEIVGWTHSHGSMQPFHSSWDEENFRTILHEIATQTMYRNTEPAFVMEGETLRVDRYVIEGVKQAGGRVKVLAKEEREPFAFSLVVNDHDDYYTECITKTYDSLNKRFIVNEPFHPELEVVDVDDDIQFDIPDMEWEIYEKLRINRTDPHNPTAKIYSCPEYTRIAKRFFDVASGYIRSNGRYSRLFESLLTGDEQESRFQMIKAAEPGEATADISDVLADSKDEAVGNLEAGLQRSHFRRFKDPNTKYRKFELQNLVYLQMMIGVIKAGNDQARIDSQVRLYQQRADVLEECASIAEGAVKSLPRYAMEEFTDYKDEKGHNYRRLVTNILANLSTDANFHLLDSIRRETGKHPTFGKKKQFFLYEDRVNIFNQLVKDLYYIRIGKCNSQYNANITGFLQEFPDAYLNDPKRCDSLVEQHVLPVRQQPDQFERYRDSALREYEHQESLNLRSIIHYVKSLIPRQRVKPYGAAKK